MISSPRMHPTAHRSTAADCCCDPNSNSGARYLTIDITVLLPYPSFSILRNLIRLFSNNVIFENVHCVYSDSLCEFGNWRSIGSLNSFFCPLPYHNVTTHGVIMLFSSANVLASPKSATLRIPDPLRRRFDNWNGREIEEVVR